MNYKGEYSGGTEYSVGDVVVYTDGIAYKMTKAAAAGTTPHDRRYWEQLKRPLQDVVLMFHGFLESIPKNISDTAITLADESDNEYLITVDGSGDTPELVVTLIEEESGT